MTSLAFIYNETRYRYSCVYFSALSEEDFEFGNFDQAEGQNVPSTTMNSEEKGEASGMKPEETFGECDDVIHPSSHHHIFHDDIDHLGASHHVVDTSSSTPSHSNETVQEKERTTLLSEEIKSPTQSPAIQNEYFGGKSEDFSFQESVPVEEQTSTYLHRCRCDDRDVRWTDDVSDFLAAESG